MKVIALKFCNNWSEYRRVFFAVSLRESRPGNMLFEPLNMQNGDVTRLTWQPIGGRRVGREGRHPVITAGGILHTVSSRSRYIVNTLKLSYRTL